MARAYSVILKFDIPENYDLYMTCHAHGWKNLFPFRWDDADKALHFVALINRIPADFFSIQTGNIIVVTVKSSEQMDDKCLEDAKSIIRRSLALGIDTIPLLKKAEKAGIEYANLIKAGAGRLLRSPTLWEDAAKTLFTTNCTWSLTQKMCKAICSDAFSMPAPSGNYHFPLPEKIASLSIGKLKEAVPVGYRAEYLVSLAKHFIQDPFLQDIENMGNGNKSADAIIRKLRGFGDYATAHMLILSGYYDKIPLDSVVLAYLKRNYRFRKPQSFIDRRYRKWGRYKWWGLKLEKILHNQNWLGD